MEIGDLNYKTSSIRPCLFNKMSTDEYFQHSVQRQCKVVHLEEDSGMEGCD